MEEEPRLGPSHQPQPPLGARPEQGLESILRLIPRRAHSPLLSGGGWWRGGGVSHLPLQQLLRPHVLGEKLFPRVVVDQRAVAQVVFKRERNGIRGGRMEACPSGYHLPFLPARDGGCSPGNTWSSPGEGSG